MATIRGSMDHVSARRVTHGLADAVRAVTMPTAGLRGLQREMRRSNDERIKLLRNLSRYNLMLRQSTSRSSAKS